MIYRMQSSSVTIFGVMFVICDFNRVIESTRSEPEFKKCICSSKACTDIGAKICRTRYSCYTEYIYELKSSVSRMKITRGCTEVAVPLLCTGIDTKSSHDKKKPKSMEKRSWTRLSCCDEYDYCNAVDEEFNNLIDQEPRLLVSPPIESKFANIDRNVQVSKIKSKEEIRETELASESHHVFTLHPKDPNSALIHRNELAGFKYQTVLHYAALVLAAAALFSVFGACYVVTRFV